jgi:hypothetical protein
MQIHLQEQYLCCGNQATLATRSIIVNVLQFHFQAALPAVSNGGFA